VPFLDKGNLMSAVFNNVFKRLQHSIP
jgi:hypothetical protein